MKSIFTRPVSPFDFCIARRSVMCLLLVSIGCLPNAYSSDWELQHAEGQLSTWNFYGATNETFQDVKLSTMSAAISCKPVVNVSLNQEGYAVVTGYMMVNGPEYLPDQYTVDIMGPLSDTVTCDNIGEDLMAVVTEIPTGNSCMSMINVEDKLPPQFSCTSDTLPCNTDIPSIDFESYLESVTDNCDPEPDYWYSFVVQVLGCNPDRFTHQILVTWTATDLYGNTGTCVDTLYLQRPLLDDIDFPQDVTIACDEMIDTDPSNTGVPTIEGEPIGFSCQLTTFRGDVVIPMCIPTYKIRRTWTVMDWCTGSSTSMVQEILIVDNNNPVITCPPDITLDTDLGDCTTDYTLPLPVMLSDACADSSDIEVVITIDANPPLPGFFSPGQIVNLGAGTTVITMRATDPCGNSATCQYTITIEDESPPGIVCPDDITLDCDSSTDPAMTGLATATDDCDSNPIVTYTDVTITNEGCISGYKVTRTWTAEDASGNKSSCMQMILLTDQSPPTIICPEDITIACDESTDPVDTGFASATDGCDAMPVITFSDVTVSGPCPHRFTIQRTWTAMDDCGHMGSCVQVISIEDTTPPLISCPFDMTIECSSPIPTDMASATDNCSSSLNITYSDIVCANPVLGFAGPYDIGLWTTIIPAEGGSVTVMGDDEVMLTSPDVTIGCDDASVQFSIDITSSGHIVFDWYFETQDVDGPFYDPFGYNLNGTFFQLTDDAGDDVQHGRTSVEVTAGDVFAFDQRATDCIEGPGATSVVNFLACTEDMDDPCNVLIIRTHTATDECANEAACIQTILLVDTTPPDISCPDAVTIECTESTQPVNTGMASVTDNCDASPTLSFSDVILDIPLCAQAYVINRTWITEDDCGNTNFCVQVITVEDSTPPDMSCPPDVTIECTDSTLPVSTGNASATDLCGDVPVIEYTDVTLAGGCPQEYSIIRTWLAADACGNTSTCDQLIIVEDSTPPLISCPSDITLECDESTSPDNTGIASATDNCDVSPVFTFSDAVTDGVCPQAFTITRTWIAADACGNSNTCQQIISIEDNLPPDVTCPMDVTISCAESSDPTDLGMATATDLCDPSPDVTFSDLIVPGNCNGEATVFRTWTAMDACGNSSTCVQQISITDDTPPVFTSCPADVTIECGESTLPDDTGIATATDLCDVSVEITYLDVILAGMCPQEFTINRVWIATDDCGNSTSCQQVISVEDNTPPNILCPVDITIACTESTEPGNTGLASATDACDANPLVTYNDVVVGGGCPGEGGIMRTWTATDACGNTSTCLQIISVDDDTPPVITDCPPDLTIECDDDTLPVSTGFASATDDCDSAPVITYSDSIADGDCPQDYTITRIWTAMDACGNSSTCAQMISVEDNTLPVITFCPPDVTISCEESTAPGNTGTASATDNCSADVTITFDDSISDGACPQEITLTRVWIATDDCGNFSTCVQMITTEDTSPPLITCPAHITVACDESILPDNTGMAGATDNCDPVPVVTYNDVTLGSQFCAEQSTILRTWTITDACGNGTNCIQIITIIDITPPQFTPCPADITIECGEDPSPENIGFASASDNCDSAPVITYSDITTEGTCGSNYSVTRTWTATDACGNAATCVQMIFVEDNTPPVCSAQDITITEILDPETGVIYITAEMIDDGSFDACGGPVTLEVIPDSLLCEDEGPNEVTLVVTDECGNSSTCTAIVTIDCIDPCVNIMGWVYLAGAATDPTGLPDTYTVPMRTDLNDLHVLPGQSYFDPFFGVKYTPPGQPYSGAPWFYPGMEGDMFDSGGDPMMGDAGYPPTVVDWVLVSLREDSAGTDGPVCMAAALVHNDGAIEFVEEFDCCNLDLEASYFLVVEHRNHLIVMSDDSLPIDLNNSTITYDFRIQQSYLDDPFMFGASAQLEILPGIYAMLAANGEQSSSDNADTDINISDRVAWQDDNSSVGEYRVGDYNLNGDTNFNDRITWEFFNDNFTSVPRD